MFRNPRVGHDQRNRRGTCSVPTVQRVGSNGQESDPEQEGGNLQFASYRIPCRLAFACGVAISASAQAQQASDATHRVGATPLLAQYDAGKRHGGRNARTKPAAAPTADKAADPQHHDDHDENPIQVDVGILYDDNVSRAWRGPDVLRDSSISLGAQTARFFPVDTHSRVMLGGSVGVEKFDRYDGLDRVFGAVRAEIQYRPSAEFFAPTWALFGRVLGEHYDSNLRRGWRYSVGAYVMQPVTDRIQLLATVAHNERDAKSAVFDGRENSAQIGLDYALAEKHTLYASGDYRRGDTVSDGRASLASIDLAKWFAPDNAFPGKNLFAYRLEAKTTIATVGYNYALSEGHALDISWRRSVAKSVETPTFRGASRARYEVNQYSLSYLLRF